jgi:hypothetical protein
MRLGYIKDIVVMARPVIYDAAGAVVNAALGDNKVCLQGTLKQIVNKCDIWFNSELVFSESNLEPYFGICDQIKGE